MAVNEYLMAQNYLPNRLLCKIRDECGEKWDRPTTIRASSASYEKRMSDEKAAALFFTVFDNCRLSGKNALTERVTTVGGQVALCSLRKDREWK